MKNLEKKTKDKIFCVCLIILCVLMIVLDLVKITYTKNALNNKFISKAIPLFIGIVAVTILLIKSNNGIFGKPEKLLYIIPALLVAINNFPFYSYFTNKSQFLDITTSNLIWFCVYYLCVGFFEEFIFRGIFFPLICGIMSKDKKGMIKAFFISSIIFGLMHLFNLLLGAGFGPTILQIGYSTLIGGLCCYVLIKTKNIIFPALIHSIYDICGMLLSDSNGLGKGVVFDVPTAIMMAVVGVIVGIFVLYCVFTYKDEEREELYKKFKINS